MKRTSPRRSTRPPAAASGAAPAGAPERIQKILARAGVASRRAIEALIREGRVKVNGAPATIGQRVGPNDQVRIDGRGVALPRGEEQVRVLAYKKRTGEIVTRDDPEGRRTVFRRLPRLEGGRWIAIGRLDINTSGLLLFTNSGELARRLMHPSFEIEREYAVRVLGEVDEAVLERLQRGVRLDDGPGRFEKVWRSDGPGSDEDGAQASGPANRWFQVVVKQGRNRLVRRLWESQRCQVSRLMRVRYGPVELGRGIRSAGWRELEPHEVRELRRAVGLEPERGGRAPGPS
jgi:pseudouridine synthase